MFGTVFTLKTVKMIYFWFCDLDRTTVPEIYLDLKHSCLPYYIKYENRY